jgi:hypothetical protein
MTMAPTPATPATPASHDGGQPVGAEVYYELRLQPGPFELVVEGDLYVFEKGATALVRIVLSQGIVIDETIIGVLGEGEVLHARQFVRCGGRLRLGKGLS